MESSYYMVTQKYNFNYRFVDIPNWQQVAKEVEKRIPSDIYTQHGFLDIEKYLLLPAPGLINLIEFISSLNNIIQFGIVNLLPKQNIDDFPIHTDNTIYPLILSIPIYNCEYVDTVFYKFKETVEEPNTVTAYTKNQRETHNFNLFSFHLMEKIDSFQLTSPAFVNSWIPHTAINLTDDRRTMFNIRFKRPIDPKFYS